jgi:hypothetical protein
MEELERCTVKSEKILSIDSAVKLLEKNFINNQKTTSYLTTDTTYQVQELRDNLASYVSAQGKHPFLT